MIVVLTGAYRNVGDHLIGMRAIALLKEYVDKDIVNLNRSNITENDYITMNRATAVILCGGPAYQKEIYPKVYPINYKKIIVPIIPMGLGWKSDLSDTPDNFKFAPKAEEFVKHVHRNIDHSSVRDNLTLEVVRKQGISNVQMTGCPAWYDLEYLNTEFEYFNDVKQVVISLPAKYHKQIPVLLKFLKTRYPNVEKIITFHHGFWLRFNKSGLRASFDFMRMALVGVMYGFKSVDLSADTDKLKIYDAPNSLHIGYRVHAHLYCLSHKKPSFLINEDVRGTGQSKSLGLTGCDCHALDIATTLGADLDAYEASQGGTFKPGFDKMAKTFNVMKAFLKTIADLKS